MNRRGFLGSLLAAPVVAMVPDVLRPGLFGRAWKAALTLDQLHGALDRARAGLGWGPPDHDTADTRIFRGRTRYWIDDDGGPIAVDLPDGRRLLVPEGETLLLRCVDGVYEVAS